MFEALDVLVFISILVGEILGVFSTDPEISTVFVISGVTVLVFVIVLVKKEKADVSLGVGVIVEVIIVVAICVRVAVRVLVEVFTGIVLVCVTWAGDPFVTGPKNSETEFTSITSNL